MNKKYSIFEIVIILAVVFLLTPLLSFWISFLFGWVAKFMIGNLLCKSFSYIGLTIIPDQIPYIAGLLGWIGSFFKKLNTEN